MGTMIQNNMYVFVFFVLSFSNIKGLCIAIGGKSPSFSSLIGCDGSADGRVCLSGTWDSFEILMVGAFRIFIGPPFDEANCDVAVDRIRFVVDDAGNSSRENWEKAGFLYEWKKESFHMLCAT